MALNKLTYVDNVTVIPASNLNAIQDEIIANGTAIQTEVSQRAYQDLQLETNKADKSDTYTKTEVDEAITEVQTEVEQDYAKIDGYYSEMTVGDAEQLVATQYVEDSEPYLFRTTGGSVDVGNREYVDEIVGGSVGWNQLANFQQGQIPSNANGVTYAYTDGTSVLLNGTATANENRTGWFALTETAGLEAFRVGRKLLIAPILVSGTVDGSITFLLPPNTRVALGNANIGILGYSSGTQVRGVHSIAQGTVMTNAEVTLIVSDLTAMFGSTIADYVYALEQATAGAGVTWLKTHFPKMFGQYNAYDAGSIKSVEGISEHKTVGFNQWDEEVESGYYDITDGTAKSGANWRRSKNAIRCFPNTGYYFNPPVGYTGSFGALLFYDADGNFISARTSGGNSFTTPSNCYQIKFYANKGWIEGVTQPICINLSWSGYRNGEYEPYAEHSYPLDSSKEMRGIFKLDSQNRLYADGDIYPPSGEFQRRYDIVDLGTIVWTYRTDTAVPIFQAQNAINAKPLSNADTVANAVCSRYVLTTSNNVSQSGYNKCIAVNVLGVNIYVQDSAYTDATTFKSAMSGTYLVYEKATPTTETATPYNNVQICDDFGTEEFVSTSIVPVGHNTRYPDNLRDKLQHLPSLAGSDGYYMISQQNNSMSLELFRIPKAPTTDGTYSLKASVSGGTPTYTWEVVE